MKLNKPSLSAFSIFFVRLTLTNELILKLETSKGKHLSTEELFDGNRRIIFLEILIRDSGKSDFLS